MTPEERFERIEGILEEHSVLIRNTDNRIEALTSGIEAITAQQKENADEIKALINAQMRTSLTVDRVLNGVEGLKIGMEDLKASQKKTEEMLQAFIRSLQKGGNGQT